MVRVVVRSLICWIAALVMAAAMCVIGGHSASALPAPPPADSFYDVPAGLAAAKPGQVLRSRPVVAKAIQIFPIDVQAWQLLYRTTGANGEPDAAVTTVMIPAGPAKPRPLLSYQSATDSTLRICNPSYGLVNGFPIEPANPTGPVIAPTGSLEVIFAAAALEKGWAVAMPDHGGIDNRFLTPRQPGYAVLDGIRAAEGFQPAGLAGAQTPVGLWGYSGGAIANSWTVEEQPTYAPELDIRGAAMGAPERDLEASLRSVNRTPLAGLIPLALSSIAKDDPEFSKKIDEYSTPQGLAITRRTADHCAAQNLVDNLAYDITPYLTKPLDDLLGDPVVSRAIKARGITGRAPTAPVYVYNGVTEEVAPVVGTDKLVRSYCDGGASVTYRREEFPPRPIPEIMTTHGIVLVTGAPNAWSWLSDRMSGVPAPGGCDIQTVPSTAVTPQSLSVLGPSFIGAALQTIFHLPIGADR